MRIFTILNHGTNFHRYKHNELIANLARVIDGDEVQVTGIHNSGADPDLAGDFLVTEGPGSSSGEIDAPTPGKVNPFTQVEKDASNLETDNALIDQAQESVTQWYRGAKQVIDTHKLDSFKGNIIRLKEAPDLNPDITHLFIRASRGISSMTGPAYINIKKYGPQLINEIAMSLRDNRKDFTRHFYGEVHPSNSKMSGLLSGTGWEDNVLRAVNIVANLQPLPDIVNIIGWSRGAITSFKQARMFYDIFGTEIDINIFAVDPVYGGKLGTPAGEERVVTDNVKNLLTILALHDRRKTFKPHDLNTMQINRAATTTVFLPMAGDHSSVVKSDLNLGESAKLVFDLATKWLTYFGTRFQPGYSFAPTQTCSLYDNMLGSEPEYEAKKGGRATAMGLYKRRDVLMEHDRYVLGHELFVNEHHRICFKTAWPRVYNWLFGPAPNVASPAALGPLMIQVIRELKVLAMSNPKTAEIIGMLGEDATGRNIESRVIDFRWPLVWPM